VKTNELFASVLWLMLLLHCFGAEAGAAEMSGKSILSVGLENQTGLALTVYNANLALVRDQREFEAPAGEGELRFPEVASKIIPSSVYIGGESAGEGFSVLEQNYEYDLLNPQKLLDKYIGKEIKLYYKNPYTDKEEIISAVLLSTDGGPVYKIGDEITYGHPGRIIFPGLPANLFPVPTLVWKYESVSGGRHTIEISYLTNGFSWHADYILGMDAEGTAADLSAWVAIDNRSGASYRKAQLKLIAGEINRVKSEPELSGRMLSAEKAAAPAPQFREEGLFEYHLYALGRPLTIMNNETKEIRFMSAGGIRIRKEFVYQGSQNYYYNPHPGKALKRPVDVDLSFENKTESGLGVPLPGGTVRIYRRDRKGGQEFVGEDTINHTPAGEEIRIKAGEAFDITADRKQTDWKKIATGTYETGFEISLRNHKDEDVVVKIKEPIPGDWTILSSSSKYEKTNAFEAEFDVPVRRNGEAVLTYTVRTKY